MCNGSDIEVNHRLRVRYRYRYPGSVLDTLSEMIPSAKPPPQLLDLTHACVAERVIGNDWSLLVIISESAFLFFTSLSHILSVSDWY